jgi:hypothetical protein
LGGRKLEGHAAIPAYGVFFLSEVH